MSKRHVSKTHGHVTSHPTKPDDTPCYDTQLTIFSCLDNRCIDCAHFSRFDAHTRGRPNGWYREDTGCCDIDGLATLAYHSCESFVYADLTWDDLHFLRYELNSGNFDDPETQARLDKIAERNSR